MAQSGKDALRVRFDGGLKLEFHGSKVTSDAGLEKRSLADPKGRPEGSRASAVSSAERGVSPRTDLVRIRSFDNTDDER